MDQCVSAGARPWYAWKHSIQPLANCSWPGTQFCGVASQKCMWLSTTKYFSPSFSYMVLPPGAHGSGATYAGRGSAADQVEADVLGGVLGIGEHDRAVVEVDHPAVVGGHVLLELGGVVVALLLAEGVGDLGVDEVHPADRVDADHRRQRGHRDVLLLLHDPGDDRADLVVHQRHAAAVRRGVVGLERALGGRR